MNIYQVFPRLFHAHRKKNIPFGTLEDNGCGKFNYFNNSVLHAIRSMGFSHVWFTGIIRHATCTDYQKFTIDKDNSLIVKGVAGSPYAIKDYFDVDPDLAEEVPNRMKEFEVLVDRCHTNGLKVIIDFVPNHVCRQYRSICKPQGTSDLGENDDVSHFFHPKNNFYYLNEPLNLPATIRYPYNQHIPEYNENPAKATGNDVFHAHPTVNDWYETVKLNYGINYRTGEKHFNPIPDTWYKMREILIFWCEKKIDGFRVDMAEMVPMEFWNWVIPAIKNQYRDIVFIAEVYNPSRYKEFLFSGFDFLYDKEQFYNTCRDILKGYTSTQALTRVWQEQEGIGGRMLRFLENHDEQRLASKYFCGDANFALSAFLVTATMHSGPIMVYFGQELGEPASDSEGYSGDDGRTTIFDYWCVDSICRWIGNGKCNEEFLTEKERYIREYYIACLSLRNKYKSVLQGGFFDLMYVNKHNWWADKVYAYLRYNAEYLILIVANFDRWERKEILLRIPALAFDMIGIKEEAFLEFSNQLKPRIELKIFVSDCIKEGLSLTIEANGGLFLVHKF